MAINRLMKVYTGGTIEDFFFSTFGFRHIELFLATSSLPVSTATFFKEVNVDNAAHLTQHFVFAEKASSNKTNKEGGRWQFFELRLATVVRWQALKKGR